MCYCSQSRRPSRTPRTQFFEIMSKNSHLLINLLPTPQDPCITTGLRCANKFPRIPTRTRNTRHLSPTVLRSVSLGLSICTFNVCLFLSHSVHAFVYRHCVFIYCYYVTCYYSILLCYLVSWPPDWIKLLLLHNCKGRCRWLTSTKINTLAFARVKLDIPLHSIVGTTIYYFLQATHYNRIISSACNIRPVKAFLTQMP